MSETDASSQGVITEKRRERQRQMGDYVIMSLAPVQEELFMLGPLRESLMSRRNMDRF